MNNITNKEENKMEKNANCNIADIKVNGVDDHKEENKMEKNANCNIADIKDNGVDAHKQPGKVHNEQQSNQQDDVSHNTDIFTVIGLGRWHILPILVAFLYQAASPTQLISSVFTNMQLDHRCVTIPETTPISSPTQLISSVVTNMPLDHRCVTIPETTPISYDNACSFLDYNHLNISCSKFEFDHSVFKSTFTSEFELVCDKGWISNLYQVSVTVGLSIGSLLAGIGDKFGRLPVIRVGALGCLIGVLLVGFGPNIYLILTGRLLTGIFCNILNVSSYTLAIENTPPQERSKICSILMIGYPMSVVLEGIISYDVRNWRLLHLSISFYIYFIVILSFFLDKSLRWLYLNGQFEELTTLLEKIAKVLKSSKKEIYFSEYVNKCRANHMLKELRSKYELSLYKKLKQTVTVFFKNDAMISISLTTPIIWFITGLVYFGVPLNANNFTDNPFIYTVALGVVEIIAIILGVMVIGKFGNIRTCAVCFAITGSCLLSILIVNEQMWWLKWIFILIAMMLISVCYIICYIISSELYPTEVRATGLGICTFFSFMGFIVSSLLSETVARYSSWVFNVVCSAFCFIAAVLIVCLLPETKGEPLCDTADDVAERRNRLRGQALDLI